MSIECPERALPSIREIIGAAPVAVIGGEGTRIPRWVFCAAGQDRNGTQEKTGDLLRLEPDGSRQRSDMTVGTVYYELNKWVSFAFEESLYRTRANTAAG